MQNHILNPNTYHLPEGSYYTTGSRYTGLSHIDKQRAFVDVKTNERVSIHNFSEVAHSPKKQK